MIGYLSMNTKNSDDNTTTTTNNNNNNNNNNELSVYWRCCAIAFLVGDQ